MKKELGELRGRKGGGGEGEEGTEDVKGGKRGKRRRERVAPASSDRGNVAAYSSAKRWFRNHVLKKNPRLDPFMGWAWVWLGRVFLSFFFLPTFPFLTISPGISIINIGSKIMQ